MEWNVDCISLSDRAHFPAMRTSRITDPVMLWCSKEGDVGWHGIVLVGDCERSVHWYALSCVVGFPTPVNTEDKRSIETGDICDLQHASLAHCLIVSPGYRSSSRGVLSSQHMPDDGALRE